MLTSALCMVPAVRHLLGSQTKPPAYTFLNTVATKDIGVSTSKVKSNKVIQNHPDKLINNQTSKW